MEHRDRAGITGLEGEGAGEIVGAVVPDGDELVGSVAGGGRGEEEGEATHGDRLRTRGRWTWPGVEVIVRRAMGGRGRKLARVVAWRTCVERDRRHRHRWNQS